jgi:hypothetical protein
MVSPELKMNDVFLKAISSVRQVKEDQKKLREQQSVPQRGERQ